MGNIKEALCVASTLNFIEVHGKTFTPWRFSCRTLNKLVFSRNVTLTQESSLMEKTA